MNNEEVKKYEPIDLIPYVRQLFRFWYLIVVMALVCGMAYYVYAREKIEPRYQASATIYVNNSGSGTISYGNGTFNISSNTDITSLYRVIMKSRLTLEKVISEGNFEYSYDQLNGMVSSSTVDDTDVFKITVDDTNPEEARDIANTIVKVLTDQISDIVGGTVHTVDLAVTPTASYYPDYSSFAKKGAMAGAAIAFVLICISVYFNKAINSSDWLVEHYGEEIPVLAVVPNMNKEKNKKGYY